MPSTRTTILVTLGVAVLFGAWWVTYARPIVFCRFLQEDAMDLAFCGTYYRLRSYEAQPEAALDWLLTNHGAAPSHQVMLTLLDWVDEGPDGFIDILSRFEDEDAAVFIRRFAFAITDSSESERFMRLFMPRRGENDRLRKILERLEGAADG